MSEEFKDRWESWIYRFYKRKKPSVNPKIPAIRQVPRFFELAQYERGKSFEVYVPVAVRNWWMLWTFLILIIWLVFFPIGLGLSTVSASWDRSAFFNPIPLSVTFVLLLLATYGLFRLAFPRICIRADADGVQVGDLFFRWEKVEGFRMGYSIGGVVRHANQYPFHGVRMAYGNYGEDLPYLFSSYYVAIYVVILNEMLASIAEDSAPRLRGNSKPKVNKVLY